jgi:hypothetical protein
MESMNKIYTNKEVLFDGLDAEKSATNHYNTFSNECAHENVRSTVMEVKPIRIPLKIFIISINSSLNLNYYCWYYC